MFDFFLMKSEISMLSLLLVLWMILLFSIKNIYIHQKMKWWIYIILFMMLFFMTKITLMLSLMVFFILVHYEFIHTLLLMKNNYLNKFVKSIYFMLFSILLFGLVFFIYNETSLFLYLFILISFSDMVAYFVGKKFPWKKWFTKLSPNKTLSWFIAQMFFMMCSMITYAMYINISYNITVMLIIMFIWMSAPMWDLVESYFKSKAWIKDMETYIPWHWWMLDSMDSMFLSWWVIWLFTFMLW